MQISEPSRGDSDPLHLRETQQSVPDKYIMRSEASLLWIPLAMDDKYLNNFMCVPLVGFG